MRTHIAAELEKSTNPGKKGVQGKPGDVTEDGIPNPETELGRAKLIQKLELAGGNVRMRAQILEKALKAVDKATNREDFRNLMYDLTKHFIKMKNTDIVDFSKELVHVLDQYEQSRGRKLDPAVVDYLRVARVARVRAHAKSR